MNRILSAVVPFAVLLFWNKLTSTPAADATAAQQSSVAKSQLAVTRFLAERLTDAPLSEAAISLILLAALLFSVIVGYLCHIGLANRAFGPRINGVLCFFGAAVAVLGWALITPKAYLGGPTSLLLVGSVGAVAFVLLFALIKAALIVRFDEVASGARPVSFGAKGHRSASRLNAVTSRRR